MVCIFLICRIWRGHFHISIEQHFVFVVTIGCRNSNRMVTCSARLCFVLESVQCDLAKFVTPRSLSLLFLSPTLRRHFPIYWGDDLLLFFLLIDLMGTRIWCVVVWCGAVVYCGVQYGEGMHSHQENRCVLR